MPAFLDFHSMGRYNDDDLKKSLKEPRNELEVKVLNTFYDLDSGMMFCLVDAPDRYAVERHHSKYGMKCDWITPIKMTSGYDNSDQEEN
ncbi:MAG: nickel-binding protein [Nitrososphaeraceae archaeon]